LLRVRDAARARSARHLRLFPPASRAQIVQVDDDRGEIVQRSVFDHAYPATRILWAPEPASREKDLLAT
jgi:hypothetical protein